MVTCLAQGTLSEVARGFRARALEARPPVTEGAERDRLDVAAADSARRHRVSGHYPQYFGLASSMARLEDALRRSYAR